MQSELFEKKLFGLLGQKLSHSFSQKYFRQKFINDSIVDADFLNFELMNLTELRKLVLSYPTLEGFFVTIPYKEQIFKYIDEVDEVATKIGAVNLVKCIRSGNAFKLKGYNTDYLGFAASLEPLLTGEEKNAIILGTGGASKAVHFALNRKGLNVTRISRSKKSIPDCINYQEITKTIMNHTDIIVNTTPLGMYPDIHSFPEIPYHFLKKGVIAYDLVYNPEKTTFLIKAEENGAKVLNGYKMLIIQAENGWAILNTKE